MSSIGGPISPYKHVAGKFLGEMNILGVLSEKFGKIFGSVLKLPSFGLDEQKKPMVRVSKKELEKFLKNHGVFEGSKRVMEGGKEVLKAGWGKSVAKSPFHLKALYTRSVAEDFVAQKGMLRKGKNDMFSINVKNFFELSSILENAGFKCNQQLLIDMGKRMEDDPTGRTIWYNLTKDQLKLLFFPEYTPAEPISMNDTLKHILPEYTPDKELGYNVAAHAKIEEGKVTLIPCGWARRVSKKERANQAVFDRNFWQECVDTLMANTSKGWQRVHNTLSKEQKIIISEHHGTLPPSDR